MKKRKISLFLTLTILIVSLLGGCGVTPKDETSDDKGSPEKDGYVLDFSTEFNDGKLDTELWLPSICLTVQLT